MDFVIANHEAIAEALADRADDDRAGRQGQDRSSQTAETTAG